MCDDAREAVAEIADDNLRAEGVEVTAAVHARAREEAQRQDDRQRRKRRVRRLGKAGRRALVVTVRPRIHDNVVADQGRPHGVPDVCLEDPLAEGGGERKGSGEERRRR